MRKVLALVVALVVAVAAAPALAGDGTVPQATLTSLGLGDMQVVSDSEGMQVRGMSSNAWATSFSMFSSILFDPFSGANFVIKADDFGRSTDENAGLNATSSANAATDVNVVPVNISITTGSNTWSVTFGGVHVTGMASAFTP